MLMLMLMLNTNTDFGKSKEKDEFGRKSTALFSQKDEAEPLPVPGSELQEYGTSPTL